jgi:outer membrane lipoprotein-sorting protein
VVKRSRRVISVFLIGLAMSLCIPSMGVQPERVLAIDPPSAHITMVVSMEKEGLKNSKVEVWTKKDKLRLDLTLPVSGLGGAKVKGVIIVTSEGGYIYLPKFKVAKELSPLKDLLAAEGLPLDLSERTMAMSEDIMTLLKEGRFTHDLLVWIKKKLDLSDKEVEELKKGGLSDENILALMEKALREGESARILGQEEVKGKKCTLFEIIFRDGSKTKIWLEQGRRERYPLKVEVVGSDGATLMTAEISQLDLGAKVPDSKFEPPPDVIILEPGAFEAPLGL